MRRSQLFLKTTKDAAKDEVSRNAQLLTRAGYVNMLMAGAYSYLPLGLRVLRKVENIIREEMDAIGGQEVLMPALHPKDNWETTGRWEKMADVLFKLKGAGDRDLTLGPTHEEVVTPMAMGVIGSYRDLPRAVYQIQSKYRNEARAKSGLLRGREFIMKDLYSFHATQEDLDAFYDKAMEAYMRVYDRVGLGGGRTLITYASGGAFSKFSHEFQTLTESGEDRVYTLGDNRHGINEEILDEEEAMRDVLGKHKGAYAPGDEKALPMEKAIEVGNIFKLGTRFSEAFGLKFLDADGVAKYPVMGCYGIGPSRLVGTIAEVLSDDAGLVWPEAIAPYKVNLLTLRTDDAACRELGDKLYAEWTGQGMDVLYDDRDARAGEKFADADLIGCPWQAVVGPKGAEAGVVEWKNRATGEKSELPVGQWPW